MTDQEKLKPFLVRLRPATRRLLDQAAQSERRSRASLIDEALLAHLENRYSDTAARLEALLDSQR